MVNRPLTVPWTNFLTLTIMHTCSPIAAAWTARRAESVSFDQPFVVVPPGELDHRRVHAMVASVPHRRSGAAGMMVPSWERALRRLLSREERAVRWLHDPQHPLNPDEDLLVGRRR